MEKNIFYYDEEKYNDFRHRIHKEPELAFKEKLTKDKILTLIKTFSNYDKIFLYEPNCTGFWIDVKGLADPNGDDTIIALRTDLDALPLQELTNKEYKSIFDSVHHACGHDGHITIITATLESVLLNIYNIPSNITLRFLYQPAEEANGGAREMMKHGCLKGVDEIYGLHNVPILNLGTIGIKSGPFMAGFVQFDIEIIGQGGHGSAPYLAKSPINTGSELIQQLNQLVSQRINSEERIVLTVGSFNSGETFNVIPDIAKLNGSIRYFNKDTVNKLLEEMQQAINGLETLNKSKINLKISHGGEVVMNDKSLTDNVVIPALKELKEYEFTDKGMPVTASEDFSEYQKIIPGVFIFIGGYDEDHKPIVHSPYFDYNDKVTIIGMKVYLSIIEQKAGKKIFNLSK